MRAQDLQRRLEGAFITVERVTITNGVTPVLRPIKAVNQIVTSIDDDGAHDEAASLQSLAQAIVPTVPIAGRNANGDQSL